MGALEKPKSLDLEALKVAYNYKPFPPTEERVDLAIAWEEVGSRLSTATLGKFTNFHQIHEGSHECIVNSYPPRNIIVKDFPLADVPIKTAEGAFSFKVEKCVYDYQKNKKPEDLLVLRLMRDDETVLEDAQFISKREGDTWDMYERIVGEPYRENGIASNMLKLTEACVQAQANALGRDQELVVDAGQADVIDWFLKRGFEVIEEDQAKLQRLLDGDPRLMIISCPDDEKAYEKRQWYVFEKSVYDGFGENIWEDEYDEASDRAVARSQKYSYRIKLRKMFEPELKEVEKVAVGIKKKVRRIRGSKEGKK